MVFMGVMVVMGMALFNWSDSLDMQSVINKQGSEADQFTSAVFNSARNALSDSSKCGSLKGMFTSFRDFTKDSTVYSMKGNKALPCLIEGRVLKWVENYEISLEQMMRKEDYLFKDVRVSVKVTTKKIKGLRSRTFARSKIYRVSVLSLDKLGLNLFGNVSPRFVSTGPSVEVLTTVFDSSSKEKRIEEIYYSTKSQKFRFQAPVLIRGERLKDPIPGGDLSSFRSIYMQGLYTNAFNYSLFNNYLPSGSEAWNYGIDYRYQENGLAYALPEYPGGTSTVGCDKGMKYQPAAGRISRIPDPSNYLMASKSCYENVEPSYFMVINGAKNDLEITLKEGDNSFCGLITARRLTFNLEGEGEFGFFGVVNASQIRVVGSSKASLRIHNPQDNVPELVDLPGNTTQPLLSEQMRRLAGAVAKNYFLPVNASSSLKPQSPKNFMKACGGGLYEMNANYKKLNEDPEYKKSAKPSTSILYLVKEVL